MKLLSAILFTVIISICFLRCSQSDDIIKISTSEEYKKGESFINNNNDSAYFYFNKVATNSDDSLQIAMAYNKMGNIQHDAGDYFGSQEAFLNSLKFLKEEDKKDHYCLLSTYNGLGNISLKLKNYNAAIGYYDKAMEFTDNKAFKTIALNGKAVTYQKMKEYDSAITIYESIIDDSKNNKTGYARVLSNMTFVKWLKKSDYQALPDFWQALALRKEEDDNWGLNASYSHLSDYYTTVKPDSALIYAGKMYDIAQYINSPDDQLQALQKLIKLSSVGLKKEYFADYLYLNDSLQTSRNNAKNQFALIRYDVEKAKADNLSLQNENAEKKIRIIWQQIILFGTILLAILLLVWYRRKKQRAIQDHQLKTSQKVHDVVANGLYHLMIKTEHGYFSDKELLLDEMEVLYKQSRDISYETPSDYKLSDQNTLVKTIKSFATTSVDVNIKGNVKEVWSALSLKARNEIEQVLGELMINMKKHSKATTVIVRFERTQNEILIEYKDNGVGIERGTGQGNGLRNTENRIKEIKGRIIFGKIEPNGLNVHIHIPIE